MPRAFGWFVYSFLSIYPDDQTSQRGRLGSHDRVQDHGPRVGVTTVVPTTLSHGPTKAFRDLTHSTMTPCKWHGRTQPCSLPIPVHRIIQPASSCYIYELTVSKTTNFLEDYPIFCANFNETSDITFHRGCGRGELTHAVKKSLRTSYGYCGDTIADMRPG
jgi:hypothetical protein